MKKLFFHAYYMKSVLPDQPVRMCRLAWRVLNEDLKTIRGFDFAIEPENWSLQEEGAETDSGYNWNKLYVLGVPIYGVLVKFIADYEEADKLYCKNSGVIDLLIFEASRLKIGAKKRPSIRNYLPDDIFINFEHGIDSLIEYYYRPECKG